MSRDQGQPGGAVLEKKKEKTQTPRQYRVALLNDDYTTMDFVVEVLETVFAKPPAEAYRLMMQVHTQGRAICGTYPFEIAETKAGTVREMAVREGFPLQASVEEA